LHKYRLIVSPNKLGAEPLAVAPDHSSRALGWVDVVKRHRYDEILTFDKPFRDLDGKTSLAEI
jgi:hypothetical protein